eukprot:GEMP01047745.1.p1 GENE.GEMP01047745.1~~GEMP01047745.1.p1  ORF type:complete len:410 (+),score=67.52 GEMP01047745.1:54-1283(+)
MLFVFLWSVVLAATGPAAAGTSRGKTPSGPEKRRHISSDGAISKKPRTTISNDEFMGDTIQSGSFDASVSFSYATLKNNAVLSGGCAHDFLAAAFPDSATLANRDTTMVTLSDSHGIHHRWRIMEQIGRGSFGVVYRGAKVANYEGDGAAGPNMVAIKFSRSNRSRTLLLFEAHRLHRLRNARGVPHLVNFARYGENGVLMAARYYPGGDLRAYLDRNPAMLSREEMWMVAGDAFKTLDALHKHCDPPIVHGDIKPDNLLLDENRRIIFGDWGSDYQIYCRKYGSVRRLGNLRSPANEGGQATVADDFTSLLLSIFQMDGTIISNTRLENDIRRRLRDPSTGRSVDRTRYADVASKWDAMLEARMGNDPSYTTDYRLHLWKALRHWPQGNPDNSFPWILAFFETRCFQI